MKLNNTEKEIKDRFRDLDQQKKDAARAEEERIQREKQERISNSAIVRFYDFFQGKNNDYTDEELALLETIDDPELLDLDENGHLVLRSEEERAKMEGRQNAQILKDLLTEEKDGKESGEGSSAGILRIEDLDITKARVYLALAHNDINDECAYAYVIDQGYGSYRTLSMGGERMQNRNEQTMAFRAMSSVLTKYAFLVQPVNEITVFMENELGWMIEQNSYELSTAAFEEEAENYVKNFLRCRNRGIHIRLAPGLGTSTYANMAKETALKLLK